MSDGVHFSELRKGLQITLFDFENPSLGAIHMSVTSVNFKYIHTAKLRVFPGNLRIHYILKKGHVKIVANGAGPLFNFLRRPFGGHILLLFLFV